MFFLLSCCCCRCRPPPRRLRGCCSCFMLVFPTFQVIGLFYFCELLLMRAHHHQRRCTTQLPTPEFFSVSTRNAIPCCRLQGLPRLAHISYHTQLLSPQFFSVGTGHTSKIQYPAANPRVCLRGHTQLQYPAANPRVSFSAHTSDTISSCQH